MISIPLIVLWVYFVIFIVLLALGVLVCAIADYRQARHRAFRSQYLRRNVVPLLYASFLWPMLLVYALLEYLHLDLS